MCAASSPVNTSPLAMTGIVTADCVFVKDGETVAHKQKILADLPRPEKEKAAFAHTVEQDGDDVTVRGEGFAVNITGGLLSGLTYNGASLLAAPMKLNCFRAGTDNDGAIFPPNHKDDWEEKLVRTLRFGC